MQTRRSSWLPQPSEPYALFLNMIGVAAVLLVLAGDAFLLDWTIRAGDRSDIAARGPWLLAAFLPFIAFGVALIVLVLALFAGHRRKVRVGARVAAGLVAAVIAYMILYRDPIGTVWLVTGPLRSAIGLRGCVVLDALLLVIVLWMLFKRDIRRDAAPSS